MLWMHTSNIYTVHALVSVVCNHKGQVARRMAQYSTLAAGLYCIVFSLNQTSSFRSSMASRPVLQCSNVVSKYCICNCRSFFILQYPVPFSEITSRIVPDQLSTLIISCFYSFIFVPIFARSQQVFFYSLTFM